MRHFKFTATIIAASACALLAACNTDGSGDETSAVVAEGVETSVEAPPVTVEKADARAEMAKALAAAAATDGPGAPAMWRVADEDTTLYLFGTVHLLKPETEWQTDKFNAAFAEAGHLVTEVDTDSPEGLAAITQLMQQRGVFTDGRTLTGLLDDEQEAVVASALDDIGVPIAALDRLYPWFAGLNMGLIQIQQSGYSPESGVETVLTAQAKEQGMTFGYLETAEQQMNALAGGTLDEQIEGLVFTAQTLDLGPELLGALVDEWADGDVAGLGAIMADPTAIGGEDAYQRLLVDRNENWIPQIVAMLDDPGTSLIAVGAAHLAGPDSVVNMLRAEGLTVEPY
jgi:uncharacterized protein YbaP (TraB family)